MSSRRSHPEKPNTPPGLKSNPLSPAELAQVEALFAPGGLASATPLAVVAWDAQGRIRGWNAAAEQILGWKAEEVLGRSVYDLLPPTLRGHMRSIVEKLFSTQQPVHSINADETKEGRKILCEWHNSLLKDAAGRVIAGVGIGRDITREHHARQERERLHAIACAANAARDLDDILLMIRNTMIEVGGFDRAGIWLVEG